MRDELRLPEWSDVISADWREVRRDGVAAGMMMMRAVGGS